MTPEEIDRLAEAARRAGVRDLELSGPGTTLRLRIDGAVASAPEAPTPSVQAALLRWRGVQAPGVGLFRHTHPVTGRASCEAGQRVEAGQIVGFLDVGPCLRPVTAPEAGLIGAPLREDGALVGYGTPLYRLT